MFNRACALIVIVGWAWILSACGSSDDGTKKESKASLATGNKDLSIEELQWKDKNPNADLWTDQVSASLAANSAVLLATPPQDVAEYCFPFTSLNATSQMYFYAFLLSVLVEQESEFQPYFQSVAQNNVRGFGLLNLSFVNSQSYACDVHSTQQLLNPLVNLQCGVKILAQVIRQDGVIFGAGQNYLGAARIWRSLRNSVKRDQLKYLTQHLAICQQVIALASNAQGERSLASERAEENWWYLVVPLIIVIVGGVVVARRRMKPVVK